MNRKIHWFCALALMAFTAGRSQNPDTIAAWPKVELHLHLDCSLSFDVVHQLDPTITPEQYRAEFIAPPVCTDLADYISRADRQVALMQTRRGLRLATLDVFRQLQQDHVIYAEIRFAPLKHLARGLRAEQVVDVVDSAVEDGIRSTGIEVGIILCTLRHFNADESMETVRLVEKFRGRHVVGFDIAGNEAGYSLKEHVAAFQFANAHGIPCTAHAGEASGPASVWETLRQLHPTRIGHGVRSVEDTALLSHLRQNNVLLEVCPSSNLQTNMYSDLDHHPVDILYKAKVPVNINTDSRTISPITLSGEYDRLIKQFGWTKKDFLVCNLEAVEHAFTPAGVKSNLRRQLTAGYR